MTTQEAILLPPAGPVGRVRSALQRDRVAVGALVALAFLLRVPNLGRAYWIDEGISVGIASHPLGQIPGLLRMDGSPPLFYLLLHGWVRLFGTSPAATHFFPLLVSLLVTPLAYWAGRDLFDRRAGVAAAALTATSPFLGWYSTETRMYPMVCAFALLAVTFTVRALRGRRLVDVCGAVLAFTALLYTHDWGLYLFAVTGAVVILRAWRRDDLQVVIAAVAAGAAVAILWLPWLPTFLEQARETGAPWAVPPGIGDFFADPSSTLGCTIGFVVTPLLAGGVWWTRGRRDPATASTASLVAGIGMLTAASGWLVAQVVPSWTERYLAVILTPLLLGAAGALAPSRRGRRVIVGVCVLLSAWSIVGSLLPNPNARYAKSNVAAIAAAARPDLRPGDFVLVTQTEQLAVVAHYLPAGLTYATPTGVVTDPYVVDWRDLISRLQHANACAAIGPELAALPVGAHVLEVNPVRQVGTSGSAWSVVVNAQVAADNRLLATYPSLTPVHAYAEAIDPRPYSAVVGEMFVKTAGVTPCGA